MNQSAKTEKKQDSKFKPGQSGNPNGRPQGSRNKATLAMESLMEADAEAITRKCIEKAKEGDMAAIRLCMDRLYPPRKDSPVSFELPPMETAADAMQVMGAILMALASGEVTPSEAQAVAGIVETFRRTIETSEMEARLVELERAKGAKYERH
jgi:hypothetical protein